MCVTACAAVNIPSHRYIETLSGLLSSSSSTSLFSYLWKNKIPLVLYNQNEEEEEETVERLRLCSVPSSSRPPTDLLLLLMHYACCKEISQEKKKVMVSSSSSSSFRLTLRSSIFLWGRWKKKKTHLFQFNKQEGEGG